MTNRFGRASVPFFTIGLVALVVACLTLTRDYAVPIAIAVFIWLLINAFARALQRLPAIGPALPHWLAKLVAVAGMFGAVILSVRVIADNVGDLGRGVSGDEAVLLRELEALVTRLGLEGWMRLDFLLERLDVERVIGWALLTAQDLITDTGLVFLYVLFLLIDERFYDAKMHALFPDPDRRHDVEQTVGRIGTEVTLYLWLMSVISLGVALMTYFFARAVGLDGAGFWGFLAFALNFVPTIGSITAVVLPSIYGLLTLEDPVMLVVLIGGLSAVQFIAGEIVLPRVMGNRLNLSSFVIILTLVVWGAMWGPAGMFMAIPITVILVMIASRFESTRPVAIILSKDGRLPVRPRRRTTPTEVEHERVE